MTVIGILTDYLQHRKETNGKYMAQWYLLTIIKYEDFKFCFFFYEKCGN